jgi:hypothetical protein
LYLSIEDNEFEKFVDSYGNIEENLAGRILAAKMTGKFYVSDNTDFFLTNWMSKLFMFWYQEIYIILVE